MASLLLINPNTTQAVTDRLRRQLVAQLGMSCPARLHACTARFGAPYIADAATYQVGARAVLDAFALHVAEHGLPGAVLVGCFGDPAVWALRSLHPQLPAMGLAEAGMREAAAHGPFAVVTGGHAWQPLLRQLAADRGLAGPQGLVAVHTVEATGGQMAADLHAAQALLHEAAQACLAQHPGVRALVLGGATLGGLAEPLADTLGLPVVDNVAAGGRWLAGHLSSPLSGPQVGRVQP
jgi:allantoin racemase